MFIVSSARLRHDTQISFTVTFPPDITKALICLQGRGRVVRPPSLGRTPGIGAIIDDYEIRRTEREV
jgi:hypothetical protein